MCVVLASAGCGTVPPVTAEGLELRRVVIYRNGIGYFQRAGRVSSDQVHFKVRANEVGDFLATFAVIEQGGSSVRSASFPLEREDDDDDAEIVRPAVNPGIVPTPPPPPPRKPDPRRLEKVVMHLDGREHDLRVGYIAETPIWRPSYRLVVEKDGANLQAWGIVQNLSGEDWTNVTLSLIAEAPLAFQTSLQTPVIPPRPTVADAGEVIAVVPRSETSLAQEPPPPPSAVMSVPGGVPGGAAGVGAREIGSARSGASRPAPQAPSRRKAPTRALADDLYGGGGGGGAPALAPSPQRNLAALAAIAVEAGATRYDIPVPVTVPDQSSTMVMLLDKRIPGEALYLFAPDGGVPQSLSHPFRVARFTNKTGGLLERGPLAIFTEGAFVGQGMMDPLPEGATATVPFALERSVAVEQARTFGEEASRLSKIEAAVLTVERDSVTRTKYKLRNGGDRPAKLLVKHNRTGGTRLHKPPAGTEDNLGTGSALVPVAVAARASGELVVEERLAVTRNLDWMSELASDAVKAYLDDRRADPVAVKLLKVAWEARQLLLRAHQERTRLTAEQAELARSTEETRNNIKALEKNRTAGELRDKLTARLGTFSLRLEEITKRLIEVDMQANEMQVRFNDAIRAVKILDAPRNET